jgi:hypothetical protein
MQGHAFSTLFLNKKENKRKCKTPGDESCVALGPIWD